MQTVIMSAQGAYKYMYMYVHKCAVLWAGWQVVLATRENV